MRFSKWANITRLVKIILQAMLRCLRHQFPGIFRPKALKAYACFWVMSNWDPDRFYNNYTAICVRDAWDTAKIWFGEDFSCYLQSQGFYKDRNPLPHCSQIGPSF